MADFKVKQGATLVWDDSLGTGDYDLSIINMATNSAREGQKGDLGLTYSDEWICELVIQTGLAPTAGGKYDVYWGSSRSATPGVDNPGKLSGTDAWILFPIDDIKKQLIFIGSLIVTNDSILQRHIIGKFRPGNRYGMPVVHNKTDQNAGSPTTNHKFIITQRPVTSV